MKLKKIISLCKSRKHISLYYDRNRDAQWLSDGQAAYLLDVMPEIDTDVLCKLYDIDDKAQNKIYMYNQPLPDRLNFCDTNEEESEAEELGLSIILSGDTLVPFMTEEGIYYIEQKHLEPLTDNQEGTWMFSLRHDSDGRPVIAIKIGLFLAAMVYAHKMPELYIDKLEALYKQTQIAIDIAKKRENEQKSQNPAPDRS